MAGGATRTAARDEGDAVRRALADLGAVTVALESGDTGWLLPEDPGAEARTALDVEAERLTGWLAGESVNSVHASRQMREARLP